MNVRKILLGDPTIGALHLPYAKRMLAKLPTYANDIRTCTDGTIIKLSRQNGQDKIVIVAASPRKPLIISHVGSTTIDYKKKFFGDTGVEIVSDNLKMPLNGWLLVDDGEYGVLYTGTSYDEPKSYEYTLSPTDFFMDGILEPETSCGTDAKLKIGQIVRFQLAQSVEDEVWSSAVEFVVIPVGSAWESRVSPENVGVVFKSLLFAGSAIWSPYAIRSKPLFTKYTTDDKGRWGLAIGHSKLGSPIGNVLTQESLRGANYSDIIPKTNRIYYSPIKPLAPDPTIFVPEGGTPAPDESHIRKYVEPSGGKGLVATMPTRGGTATSVRAVDYEPTPGLTYIDPQCREDIAIFGDSIPTSESWMRGTSSLAYMQDGYHVRGKTWDTFTGKIKNTGFSNILDDARLIYGVTEDGRYTYVRMEKTTEFRDFRTSLYCADQLVDMWPPIEDTEFPVDEPVPEEGEVIKYGIRFIDILPDQLIINGDEVVPEVEVESYIDWYEGANTVSGVGTTFLTEYKAGDTISDGVESYTIAEVVDDLTLILTKQRINRPTKRVTIYKHKPIPLIYGGTDLQGQIILTNDSASVVGVNTKFLTDYTADGFIQDGSYVVKIASIEDDTSLTLQSNFPRSTRTFQHYRIPADGFFPLIVRPVHFRVLHTHHSGSYNAVVYAKTTVLSVEKVDIPYKKARTFPVNSTGVNFQMEQIVVKSEITYWVAVNGIRTQLTDSTGIPYTTIIRENVMTAGHRIASSGQVVTINGGFQGQPWTDVGYDTYGTLLVEETANNSHLTRIFTSSDKSFMLAFDLFPIAWSHSKVYTVLDADTDNPSGFIWPQYAGPYDFPPTADSAFPVPKGRQWLLFGGSGNLIRRIPPPTENRVNGICLIQ